MTSLRGARAVLLRAGLALVLVAAMGLWSHCVLADTPVGVTPSGFDTAVDFEFSGASATDALRMVARLGGFSLLADGSVSGSVTASLSGMTVRQTLDALATMYGWAWKKVGNTILVGDATKLKGTFEPPSVMTYKLSYASTTDIATKLGLAVPAERVRIDPRTNSVMVSGSDAELAVVRRLLDAIDAPARQVSITTRVEEIATTALKNLGIDWSFSDLNLAAVQGKVTAAVGYSTALKALEDAGSAATVAKPSITTVDGQEATILLGEKYPIAVETTVDSKTTRTVQYVDAGVILKITPHVAADGNVTVTLAPEVSSIKAITPEGYPQISTRNASTTVTVANGTTLAIGGLYQKDTEIATHKVPILGSIPLLGTAFATKRNDVKETEIVIFVTINVLDPVAGGGAASGTATGAVTGTGAGSGK